MNVADAIRKSQRRFGDSNNILISNADFFDFINDAQLQIVRKTGDIKTTLSGQAGTFFPVTYPATFIRGEGATYDGHPLQLIEKEDLDARDIDVTDFRDDPEFYYYDNGSIHLYPDPPNTDTTTATFTFWATPTVVTTVGDNLSVPISYHEDVVAFVTARCHERNENWNMYDRLMNEFNTMLGERMDEATRKDVTYPIIRDDPYDDWYS